ncbi:hypothetical protein GCK72_026192 [Caenorhabditis remanei]|uniref:DUF38 domain-containing protein n=1 Tax=Caenorhabditis remanei TaxID=31234 RepID=A0A6A5G557_CAERE|nr:hypothetical protein GCK72_026192 [Caenorhabditis remanei]KAF1749724.1 hypothetical protein GCK72_026192 [Caenorhabditis remanei]
MHSQPNLQNLPAPALRKIFMGSNFIEMQSYRKIHPKLTYFIDSENPESNLLVVIVQENDGGIHVELGSHWRYVEVDYQKHDEGCLVTASKTTLLTGKGIVERSEDDLELVLKHQRKTLEAFSFKFTSSLYNVFFDKMATYLESREKPLKVKELTLECPHTSNFKRILSSIDSEALRTIRLSKPVTETADEGIWDIHNFSTLDQWMNARELYIENMTVSIPIRDLLHFCRFEVFIQRISAEDVISLRQTAVHSHHFDYFFLGFEVYYDEQYLLEVLGEPDVQLTADNDRERKWWFSVADDDRIVEVIITNDKSIEFSKTNGLEAQNITIIV